MAALVCNLCQAKNPLANRRKTSIQEVSTPSEIIVCFHPWWNDRSCAAIDCKTARGPWITFASAEKLEKSRRYLDATHEQLAVHRTDMARCGQGSSHIRFLPNRKNLRRIDWTSSDFYDQTRVKKYTDVDASLRTTNAEPSLSGADQWRRMESFQH
jgi:hypothetical protein